MDKVRSNMTPNAGARIKGQRVAARKAGLKTGSALLAALLALSGCATTSGGALTGAEPRGPGTGAAALAAAMGGGLVGGAIGKDLDKGERRKGLEAEYRALEYGQSGQPVEWKGASAGTSGSVVAAQPYRVGSQDCRQYTHTVTTSGQSQTARGTACRNADGSWTTLT